MDFLDSAEFSSLLTSSLVEHEAVDVAALARFDAVFASPAALEAIGWEAATPLIPSMFHQSSDVRYCSVSHACMHARMHESSARLINILSSCLKNLHSCVQGVVTARARGRFAARVGQRVRVDRQ